MICRIERGDPGVSPWIRARAAAAIGADVRISIHLEADPLIHDAAHARYVEAVLALVKVGRVPVEAPVPGPGRRSSDIRLDRAPEVVIFEVETRVRALEAIIRECAEKRIAVAQTTGPGRPVHVVLVLPAIRHHKSLASAHPRIVASAFPADSEAIVRALRDPKVAWPGGGILWLESVKRALRPA